ATLLTSRPPAVRNGPPTIRSPSKTASVSTNRSVPVPADPVSGDQAVPSQVATLSTTVPPASGNCPAATRVPSRTVSAETLGTDVPPTPSPSVDQVPSRQAAMPLAGCPPAWVKRPPTIRSPSNSCSAMTAGGTKEWPTPGAEPPGNADQVVPAQRATWLTVTPPACVNAPPTMRSPSTTSSANTPVPRPPLTPTPPGPASADQVVPSQRAMWLTVTPPAVRKLPPTIRSPS